jgi:hypothetical protein
MARNGDFAAMEPYRKATAVTKSDDTVYAPTDALWVGDGNTELSVVMADGTMVTFTNVPDGTLLHIAVTKVLDTNTDAADVVALWW